MARKMTKEDFLNILGAMVGENNNIEEGKSFLRSKNGEINLNEHKSKKFLNWIKRFDGLSDEFQQFFKRDRIYHVNFRDGQKFEIWLEAENE